MLGSTFFDGFSRTSIWQYKYSLSYNVQVDLIDRPRLADLVGQLMNVGGLLLCVAFVGSRLPARGRRHRVDRPSSGTCRGSSSTA